MAPSPHEHLDVAEAGLPANQHESDYGSDFDDDETVEVIALLQQLGADEAAATPALVLESIENEVPASFAQVPSSSPAAFQTQRGSDTVEQDLNRHRQRERENARSASTEVEYDVVSRNSFFVPHEDSTNPVVFESANLNEKNVNDKRSPLQRFRTAPMKPLSVTDLVSPAWCELQYWYALTTYGRKKRTPAMKQGTAVHKVLEEQVHTTVPVTVKTREDHWGLRIWNVITSLRTLQGLRLTRELEVWGVVDGQVINGVIDELSFDCTDPDLEATLSRAEEQGNEKVELPADQSTISQYFASSGATTFEEAVRTGTRTDSPAEKVYLTDVKTRGAPSLPRGATLRPTIMQLMLYRKLVLDLTLDRVDAETIFRRYSLNSSDPFSDALIAQLGNLNLAFQPSPEPGEEPYSLASQSSQDPVSELLAHNSLAQLWRLMIAEFQHTMPHGDASLSKVLRAEFRSAHDGNVLGVRTFPYSEAELQQYLDDGMKWWRGERDARGVDVEEAFKCRMCDFADGCSWREAKIEEAAHKARLKIEARKKSVV